jgi:uncharacterized membrane protein HdeD (DUF308 family)
MRAMSELAAPARAARRDAERFWWLPLIFGIGWLLFAIIIFRFDWTSVTSIAILFGTAMLAAGAFEFFNAFAASGGWRIGHALIGVAFVVIGIVAYVHPGDTFSALAGVLSFYFIIKGIFDLALGFATLGQQLWWLRVLAGVAEILLGFWAAGNFGNKTILLLVWIGAAALIRGITDIAAAFALRP